MEEKKFCMKSRAELDEIRKQQASKKASVNENEELKVGDIARYNGHVWVKIKSISPDGLNAIVNPIHPEDIKKGRFGEEERVGTDSLEKTPKLRESKINEISDELANKVQRERFKREAEGARKERKAFLDDNVPEDEYNNIKKSYIKDKNKLFNNAMLMNKRQARKAQQESLLNEKSTKIPSDLIGLVTQISMDYGIKFDPATKRYAVEDDETGDILVTGTANTIRKWAVENGAKKPMKDPGFEIKGAETLDQVYRRNWNKAMQGMNRNESLTASKALAMSKAILENTVPYAEGTTPNDLSNIWVVRAWVDNMDSEDGYDNIEFTKVGLIGWLNKEKDLGEDDLPETISDEDLIAEIVDGFAYIGDDQEVIEIRPYSTGFSESKINEELSHDELEKWAKKYKVSTPKLAAKKVIDFVKNASRSNKAHELFGSRVFDNFFENGEKIADAVVQALIDEAEFSDSFKYTLLNFEAYMPDRVLKAIKEPVAESKISERQSWEPSVSKIGRREYAIFATENGGAVKYVKSLADAFDWIEQKWGIPRNEVVVNESKINEISDETANKVRSERQRKYLDAFKKEDKAFEKHANARAELRNSSAYKIGAPRLDHVMNAIETEKEWTRAKEEKDLAAKKLDRNRQLMNNRAKFESKINEEFPKSLRKDGYIDPENELIKGHIYSINDSAIAVFSGSWENDETPIFYYSDGTTVGEQGYTIHNVFKDVTDDYLKSMEERPEVSNLKKLKMAYDYANSKNESKINESKDYQFDNIVISIYGEPTEDSKVVEEKMSGFGMQNIEIVNVYNSEDEAVQDHLARIKAGEQPNPLVYETQETIDFINKHHHLPSLDADVYDAEYSAWAD